MTPLTKHLHLRNLDAYRKIQLILQKETAVLHARGSDGMILSFFLSAVTLRNT